MSRKAMPLDPMDLAAFVCSDSTPALGPDMDAISFVRFDQTSIKEDDVPAGSTEARVHDIVEYRTERVAKPDSPKVLIRSRKLSPAEEYLFLRQASGRQIQLIADKLRAPEKVEVQTLEKAKAQTRKGDETILGEIIQQCRPFERGAHRSPWLLEIE
jgi:hypothetical protein